MSLLVTNARLITVPAGTDDPGYIERGYMLVEDGRIAAIGAGDPDPGLTADEILDVDGKFVAPGFVSSHSHLFTSGSRGLGVDQTLYGWCTSMFSVLNNASPDQIYWATLHGSLDFLANGVTTAYNFTDPLLPWEPMVDGKRADGGGVLRDHAWHTRQADGCHDAGLRFVDSIALDATVGTDDEIFARFEASLDHVLAMDPDIALGASIMGQVQWSTRPDAAEIEVAVMDRFGVTNQAHFLETYEAIEHQQTKFQLYKNAGALRPGMMFGHFIQTTPEIIADAAAGGASMSWQPASNGRLASGIAHVPEMLDLGMKVGMGLDDQACTDVADPWQNMRMGMFMQRARTHDPLSMMPERVLRLHTLGGAEIMGVDDRVGSLEVGKFADFVVVDPRLPDIGPLWNPVRSYVLACGLRNLKQVYVGGTLVNENGVSTNPLAAEASHVLHTQLPALADEFGVIL
ncbi:amidohydrolase family protein [Microbacterium sp. T32]|uniref:amidohydrolase family protein n=1 Tax=Microbacterium sp. T32 TaxID=1776083 RepID=UPI0007ABE756|nr:amidohydrolase family protein [Microbacterium sp. T32]KZE40504.1 cytosine deaminase [Microbacterium sp. T32]